MDKKFIMILLAAVMLLPAMGQEVEVTSQRRLLEGVEGPAYYPVLNAAGNRLLFLTEDGALKYYDLTDDVTTVVTRDYVAGNDACWGGDGKVYYVTQETGEGRLVYRTGRCYDAATRQSAVVTEAQHGAVRAVPATRGGALRASGKSYNSSSDIGSAAWTEGNRVHVIVDGDERVFSPVDSWAGYLWASLSPDGRRVAFFAAGKENAKDDGHQFTSSQLLLLKADGTWQTELTKPASMTMQPTCGGGKIVYTTIDGLLYEMKIAIHE